MQDDYLVLVNGGWDVVAHYFLISPQLQAQRIYHSQIDFGWRHLAQPQNPAEEFIFGLGSYAWQSFITMGDWLYYLSRGGDWRNPQNLYRINVDGTQNTRLQEGTAFGSLIGVQGILFAIVGTGIWEGDSVLVEAVKLTENGSIAKVIGSGWESSNVILRLSDLEGTELVLLFASSYFGDSWIGGIYCIATGAIFPARAYAPTTDN